jgi:alkaline phosphatase
VNSQTLINPGGDLHGGYSWRRGGNAPWVAESDPEYLISKSKECPHAFTDSSSAGTALCSGVKTYDDAINVDSEGHQVETIGLQLQRKGFSVGAVTSVPISHATPASAYAQNVHRDDYQAIAHDLLGLRSSSHREKPLPGVDVLIGTGWEEYDRTGGRQGANFVPGWRYFTGEDLEKSDIRNGGRYRVVHRATGVDGKQALATAAEEAASNGQRLLGIFGTAGNNSHLPYRTADGNYNPTIGNRFTVERYSAADLRENPTLADIATAALTVLSQNSKGFWLMIEAGDVDWGNHDNNIDNSIGTVLDGDAAVKAVTDWVEKHGGWSDTVLIITADHGHFLHLTKPEVIAEAARKK